MNSQALKNLIKVLIGVIILGIVFTAWFIWPAVTGFRNNVFGIETEKPAAKEAVDEAIPAIPVAEYPAPAAAPAAEAVPEPVVDPCYDMARDLGAPEDMVLAICDAKPDGAGVSDALPAGTEVSIGTITFDDEWRVWFIRDFTVPQKTSYAFDYEGAERNFFDSGIVNGTALGYDPENNDRIPFTICWNTEDACNPGIDLFPTD